MTGASAIDLYYDPFDFEIDDVPYPIWKRLRDEAPLYYNDKYNFYALSRYVDVARELHNWETYRSGKGTVLDILLSGVEVPPGVILFEDPPLHDLHRRVLSRVFTPRRMEAIEPLARQFCSGVLLCHERRRELTCRRSFVMRCCTSDEGRPFRTALRGEVLNQHMLRWLMTVVVSDV